MSKILVRLFLIALLGCGDTPDLELRDDLRLRLTEAQSALARYEAEYREWSTETIARMKKLANEMQVDAAKVAETDDKEAGDGFIVGRKKELESLTAEMKSRLAKIEGLSEDVESFRNQLGEIEDKLGKRPTQLGKSRDSVPLANTFARSRSSRVSFRSESDPSS